MGILCVLALAAASTPSPYAIQFEGPSVSAEVDSQVAFLRAGDHVLIGSGSAFVRGQDRAKAAKLLYGDSGELWVRARVGPDVYRIELDAVGIPPEQALPPAQRTWLARKPPVPPAPDQPLEGGVMLDRAMNGDTGYGLNALPARRAELAIWGVGRLYRNDELIAPRARIFAQVFRSGIVDAKGGLEKEGRRDDPELDVFVDQVPREVARDGPLHFALDGAQLLQKAGASRREGYGGSADVEKRHKRLEADLSRRPTVDEQWASGAPMLVWERGEGEVEAPPAPPAAAPAYPPPAAGAPAPGYGAPAEAAPSAQPAPYGMAPAAPSYAPPPAYAPPATGYGLGGALGSTTGRTPTTAPGTGIFSTVPNQPSGFFVPQPQAPPAPGSTVSTIPPAPLIVEPNQPIPTPQPLTTLPTTPAPTVAAQPLATPPVLPAPVNAMPPPTVQSPMTVPTPTAVPVPAPTATAIPAPVGSSATPATPVTGVPPPAPGTPNTTPTTPSTTPTTPSTPSAPTTPTGPTY